MQEFKGLKGMCYERKILIDLFFPFIIYKSQKFEEISRKHIKHRKLNWKKKGGKGEYRCAYIPEQLQ